MIEPAGLPEPGQGLLHRLESKAARIYAWIEEHGSTDIAKAERYRVEADLYVEAAQRIRELEETLPSVVRRNDEGPDSQ